MQARSTVTGAGQRNAEVIYAMGMSGRVGRVWAEANSRVLAQQQRVSDVEGGLARCRAWRGCCCNGRCWLSGLPGDRGEVTSG